MGQHTQDEPEHTRPPDERPLGGFYPLEGREIYIYSGIWDHRFDLRPCVTVSYHRQPFRGRYHENLRMTFDRMLRCSLATTPDAVQDDFSFFLPADRSVLELKYNERISRYLMRRMNSLGLKQRPYSKYTQSIGQMMGHFRME